MSVIYTSTHSPILKQKYIGTMKTAGSLLYKPIRIHHFEFIPSKKNEGKECLIAQTSVIKKDGKVENVLLATESYKIVDTIKESMKNNVSLPYATKIIRAKQGNFKPASLSNPEQSKLESLSDPTKQGETPFDNLNNETKNK